MRGQSQALSYQKKYALAKRLRPQYQAASRAQKTVLRDAFVKLTGYARKSALRLLHHPPVTAGSITRPRASLYGPKVQGADKWRP